MDTREMHEACLAIDALGEQAVIEVRNWFCHQMLEPYKELFRPGEEVSSIYYLIKQESSFENTERRYAWLRRMIREYRDKYMNVFPDEWNM